MHDFRDDHLTLDNQLVGISLGIIASPTPIFSQFIVAPVSGGGLVCIFLYGLECHLSVDKYLILIDVCLYVECEDFNIPHFSASSVL